MPYIASNRQVSSCESVKIHNAVHTGGGLGVDRPGEATTSAQQTRALQGPWWLLLAFPLS